MRPTESLWSRRLRRTAALAALCAVALVASTFAQTVGQPRIVAVGDIHGAYDNLVDILKRAELTDDTLQWRGGNATLVQLGDILDRGSGVRRAMDLFMSLEAQARNAGGRVVNLLGNHEVMNVLGETRDTSLAAFATFADAQSEARREAAYQAYAKLASERNAARPNGPKVYRMSREEWMEAHPPGFLEYREALGPRGEYGRWLRSKPVAVLISNTIFMHAGVNPDDPPAKLDDVNSRVRDEIKKFDESVQRLVDRKVARPEFTLHELLELADAELQAASAVVTAARQSGRDPDLSGFDRVVLEEAQQIAGMGSWSALAPEGPVWFRGYATWPSNTENAAKIDKLLTKYKATHIVVGHTPIESGTITGRFGGRVFLVDTGMLNSYYKFGQASALEIDNGQFVAIYRDKRVVLGEGNGGR